MKHAYLIMAHDEPELLKCLLQQLDHDNNDIYLHIDKKSKQYDWESVLNSVKRSRIICIKPRNVVWASESIVQVEIDLLKEATKEYHDYYHLLSGHDLAIKSNEYIDDFFSKNSGKEFVSFDRVACESLNYIQRVQHYHLPRSKNSSVNKLLNSLDTIFVKLQRRLNVDRISRSDVIFMKGSEWFDVTDDFAKYIIDKMEKEYKKMFKHTFCADEVFVQTCMYNSSYYKNCFDKSIRFIDWERHANSPETLTIDYKDKIIESDCIFARKFSMKKDKQIIDYVINNF